MQISLDPALTVVAGTSSVPSKLLRETAGLCQLEKSLPLFSYLADQHRQTHYGQIFQTFLDRDLDRYNLLNWSPIFRSWSSNIFKENNWETLTPRREALLSEFCALVLRPDEPQDYLLDIPMILSPGGRYAPPELDWCWVADDPSVKTIMPTHLRQIAEASKSVGQGQSLGIKADDYSGTVYKSVRLNGETWMTNAHPRLKVRLSGTNQRNDGVIRDYVDWESYPDFWDAESYLAAYDLMSAVWPEEFADQLEILKVVVPMNIPKQYEGQSRAIAFTVSTYQGAIFVAPSAKTLMLEMLLHEKAHVKQRYVEEIWPLLESEQTKQRFNVPWRSDPRPIAGIFEGINVFLQVVLGLSRCHLAGYYNLKRRVLDLFDHLQVGLDIIGAHARLTEAGSAYYESICHTFSKTRTEFMENEPHRQKSHNTKEDKSMNAEPELTHGQTSSSPINKINNTAINNAPALPPGYHFAISFCDTRCTQGLIDAITQDLVDVAKSIIQGYNLRTENGNYINVRVRLNRTVPLLEDEAISKQAENDTVAPEKVNDDQAQDMVPAAVEETAATPGTTAIKG